MPVRVQGPDGQLYQFPDGTDKAAAVAYFKKKGIGVKATPPPPPMPPGFLDPHGGAGSVGDIARGAAKGIVSMFEPSTYSNLARQVRDILPAYSVVGGVVVPTPNMQGMRNQIEQTNQLGKQLKEHPGYTAAELAAPALLTHAAGEVVPRVVPPAFRAALEAVTKTSPKETAALVKEAQAGNAAGNAFSKVRAAIETARENALKVGNEKYSAVNEKLDPVEADPDTIISAVGDAMDKIKGSDTEPAIIKSIDEKLREGLNYRDLQGYYSELNKELSKGTLPGDVYAAYDTLQEAIGKEMQRIADSKGMGEQLTDARNYWRRMKQTFGKPLHQGDAATSALHSLAPELAEQDTIGNRIRLLGSFDPEIPKSFRELETARAAAKGVKPGVPGIEKKIDAEDIRSRKMQSLKEKGIPQVRKVGHRIVNYGVGLHALWDAFSGRMGSLPRDLGLGVAGYGATEAFARLLERPEIQEILTRPTPADIAQIPPELRGNLGPMLKAAEAKGIKVSPALIAAAGSAAQRPRHPVLSQQSPVQ